MKKRLSLIQMDVYVNEVEYNYARVQELLSQALSEKPDIIVLPETW
ncbi:MAG: carbon-nitrogen family hydrolase, partial [Veillonella sp.]|nr:carbon-nitrogen family hydrolase [Veillonella sp.]